MIVLLTTLLFPKNVKLLVFEQGLTGGAYKVSYGT